VINDAIQGIFVYLLTKCEIKVTQRLKNGKVSGVDGIKAELLKHGGGKLTEEITRLCNHVWNTSEIPQDWQDGIPSYHSPRMAILRTATTGEESRHFLSQAKSWLASF